MASSGACSLVARTVRVGEVPSSNLGAPLVGLLRRPAQEAVFLAVSGLDAVELVDELVDAPGDVVARARTSATGGPGVGELPVDVALARDVGQASPQPIVTTTSARSASSCVSRCGRRSERSMPSSSMASTTSGCTRPRGRLRSRPKRPRGVRRRRARRARPHLGAPGVVHADEQRGGHGSGLGLAGAHDRRARVLVDAVGGDGSRSRPVRRAASAERNSSSVSAPAMHPVHWAMSALVASSMSASAMTSETAKRPPGRRTRAASRRTCGLVAGRG